MTSQKTLPLKISTITLSDVIQFTPTIPGPLRRIIFYIKYSRTNQLSNSIAIFGAKVWNCLLLEIRRLPRTAFRQKIGDPLFRIFHAEDSYVDSPTLLNKIVKR